MRGHQADLLLNDAVRRDVLKKELHAKTHAKFGNDVICPLGYYKPVHAAYVAQRSLVFLLLPQELSCGLCRNKDVGPSEARYRV